MMLNRCFVLFSFLCVVWQLSADTIYLKGYDAAGKTFSDPAHAGSFWGGTAVLPENDYVVPNAKTLRTVDNNTAGMNWAFVGRSLTLEPGGTFATKHRGNTVCITNFYLKGGWFSQHNAAGISSYPSFSGSNWVVSASESSPLTFSGHKYLQDISRRGIELRVPLSGSGAVKVGSGSQEEVFYLRLTGDNSQYTGTFLVVGTGTFPVGLYLADGKAFPHVRLSSGGVLGAIGEETVLSAADRSLFVDSTGGVLDQLYAKEWTLSVPTSGDGVLSKTGDGLVTLSNMTFTAKGLRVLSGSLGLHSVSFPDSPILTFSPDTVFEPGGKGGVDHVSAKFAFASDQKIFLDYDDGIGLGDCVSLQEGSSFVKPIRLSPRQKFPAGMVVMTIPLSSGVVKAEDFLNPILDENSFWHEYRVETSNGVQSVIVDSSSDYIVLRKGDNSNQSALAQGSTYTNWSDALPPHPDARYLIASNSVTARTPTPSLATYPFTFNGRSLTLGTSKQPAFLSHRSGAKSTTIYPELYLINGRCMNHTADHSRPVLDGDFYVYTESSSSGFFAFCGDWTNRGFRFECSLHGTGQIRFQDACAGEMMGDNRDFAGRFYVDGRTYSQFRTHSSILFKDDHAFGNQPAQMMDDAVTLHQEGTLCATNTQILAPFHRGLRINASTGQVSVVSGAVLTFASQISAWGPLKKIGAGDFIVGGTNIWQGNLVDVCEGGLSVSHPYALSNALIRVEEKGTLHFSLQQSDPEMKRLGMAFPAGVEGVGGVIPVRITGYLPGSPVQNIALFTTSGAVLAEEILSSLRVTVENGSPAVVKLSMTPQEDGSYAVVAKVGSGGTFLLLR